MLLRIVTDVFVVDIFNPTTMQLFGAEQADDKLLEDFVGGDMTYRYALLMHVLATIVHVVEWWATLAPGNWRTLETLIEIGKVFLIPLQALNLILLATVYAESPLPVELLGAEFKHQQGFKLWILIELLVMISIVASNIIFLMIRNCFRQQLDFQFSSKIDDLMDFVAS